MDGEEFLNHSTTHPKYLESNSTSHSWAFGALAEIIDNAQDANATVVNIDVISNTEHGKMLIVQDNGTGMDYKTLHKMLSFGHCVKSDGSIGRYGNGFKSGSMRMGSDAIVFTKDGTTKSVGMLSQTFLTVTHATEVLVPMVSWSEHTGEMIFRGVSREAKFMQNSLKVIHEHSPFHGMNDIETQFDLLEERGTRIIMWNLRIVENTHKLELDCDHDRYDIYLNADLLPAPDKSSNLDTQKNDHLASLRKYLTILYLVPKMRIVLRGIPVKTVIYPKTLHMAKATLYRPRGSEEIKMTFGFNADRRVYGMMLYNKNRLIEAFVPVGMHNESSSRAKGVLGICEANFLQPTHNKQKFVATSDYNKLKAELAKRLRIYWNALDLLGRIGEFWQMEKYPDEEWVQCEQCLKWRFLEKRKHALKNAKFTCSLLYKEKISSKEEACKIPQDTDCVHSHVIFNSTDKEDKTPAGREKWVGARVSLYWDSYDKWYEGYILEYDEHKNKYKVQYDDGDLMWESYDDGFKILKLDALKKPVTKENKVDVKQGARKDTKKDEEKQERKELRTTPAKRKLSEVVSPESNDRPTKRSKRLAATNGSMPSDEKQDDSKVVQMLKKKLSFIVSTLAKRGLITTDFIDLVEEDNMIELDEVKLCDSLAVNNSHPTDSNSNNNTNVNYDNSFEEEYDVNNTSRGEMFDANGNAYSDRRNEDEFIEYDDEGVEEEEEADEMNEDMSYNAVAVRPVPFIQFL